jgi:hypothetical protein
MIYSTSFIVSFFSFILGFDILPSFSIGIGSFLILRIVFVSNISFAFREWALFLYCLNYLISPAITYKLNPGLVKYPMKIPSDDYFSLAFPGFLLFAIGMFTVSNKLFNPNFEKINLVSVINQKLLKQFVIFGLFFRLSSSFFPGELSFFIYLLAMIRFLGAFALFGLDRKKWIWPSLIILLEFYFAFQGGMYHDAIMWFIFFALFYIYVTKPTIQLKLIGVLGSIILILFIQAIKFAYREKVWEDGNEASLSTITDVGASKANSESLIGEDNLLGTLNRGNQAWIFASTVNRMDSFKDFQGMNNVNKYLEAALLPRFLAPNKIKSGGGEIFNQFSGHTINESTSMGLGIFADGYIAYGAWGVYIFGFVLGLIFSLTFKLVERWTKISPFYVLLLLPMLNYAVRPDCELQTTINHLAKSIVVFGGLVYFTKNRFTLESANAKRKLLHLNLMK